MSKRSGTTPSRFHYYLASVEVVYTRDNSLDQSAKFNVIASNITQQFNVANMQQLQQAAQMRLFQALGPQTKLDTINVKDVFTIGVSYLGEMTEAEFNTQMPPPQKKDIANALAQAKVEGSELFDQKDGMVD